MFRNGTPGHMNKKPGNEESDMHFTPADIEFRIARDEETKATIYRFRNDVFHARGEMIEPDPTGLFRDAFEETGDLFGMHVNDQLIGSVRIHVGGPGLPPTPSSLSFGEVTAPIVEAGEYYVDPTRICISPEFDQSHPMMLIKTAVRFVVMAVDHFDTDWIIAPVRRLHKPFYERQFDFDQLASLRPVPRLIEPLLLMGSQTEGMRQKIYSTRPFFESTDAERRRIFSQSTRYPRLGAINRARHRTSASSASTMVEISRSSSARPVSESAMDSAAAT